MEQTITRASNALARVTIEEMAVALRNKLESYGEPSLAQELLGLSPITIGTKLISPVATLVETFGTYTIAERHHDRVLYVAELRREANNRFGIPAASWEMDHDILATALGALANDRSITLVNVNLHATSEDPWWLMDVAVANMEELRVQYPAATPETDLMLAPIARLDVYSPWEPHHLSDISRTAPLLFLPRSFGSVAIKAVGPWSEYSQALPVLDALPDINAANGYVTNLTRPFWRDEMEIETATVFEEDDPTHPTRKRRRFEPLPSQGAAGPSALAAAQNRVYRARRVRTLYDHAVTEGAVRADITANFGVFEVIVS